MCDENMLENWRRQGLTRRNFGLATGAAAIAACAPPDKGSKGPEPAIDLKEQAVQFETEDGTMDGFFVHPTADPAPAILFWPDIAGLREAKRKMARRLASAGYAVLVANPYYRDAVGAQFADFVDFAAKQGMRKVAPWRAHLDAAAVMRDANAIVGWLDDQNVVDSARGIGTQGYCMTGPFALWSAAAMPKRIKAAASFHGGGLVRDHDPQSPHMMFGKMDASLLIAIARNDDAAEPEDKNILRQAAVAAGREAEFEVYPGDHGWCVLDSPAYAAEPAEKAWSALLNLYRAAL